VKIQRKGWTMKKFLHNLYLVVFKPFAGSRQVNGTSGPTGEGNPGGYWGNG
jgi:hypothetical protein